MNAQKGGTQLTLKLIPRYKKEKPKTPQRDNLPEFNNEILDQQSKISH